MSDEKLRHCMPSLCDPYHLSQATITIFLLCRKKLKSTQSTHCCKSRRCKAASGAGTNLKVGAPVRCESGGTGAGKFFGRAPTLFGSESTISRFGERFRDGQYS